MAKIEDLIRQIPEENLRDEIAHEVAALKSTKKFGLVFEEHIPEQVQLPGLPVREGSRVTKRASKGIEIYKVIAIEGEKALIVPEPEGKKESISIEDLMVVKRFGEPIYPTLIPRDRIQRAPEKPWHTIINADNFHALQLLLYCYEGMVDVIYIDPPYNTGARDWKYNNDFVDRNDQYRHSKWLAMMKRRLRLAKRILKPDTGVLVVTIDEHEIHHLGILLEEEFSECYRQVVTIVINQKGVAQGRLSRAEEYAIFCFMKSATVQGHTDDLLSPELLETEPRWERLIRGGVGGRREDQATLFFPIYINPKTKAIVEIGNPLPLAEKPDLESRQGEKSIAWPIRKDGSFGRWRVSPAKLRELSAKGYVKVGGYDKKRKTWTILYLGEKAQSQIETGVIRIISRDPDNGAVQVQYVKEEERQIKTVWHRSSHDAGVYGSTILRNILGSGLRFPYPKSLYAVRDAIAAIIRNNPTALVLDFFAGSGTTLHATALLNDEDSGQRRCILVTNNEVEEKLSKELNQQGLIPDQQAYEKNGICEAITWPRCKYAISGKRDDGTELTGQYLNGRKMKDGFPENIEYFRLDFLDPHDVAYGEKFNAILPILWLMAGAKGERESDDGKKRWFIPKNSPFAVLIDEYAFAEFRREIHGRHELTHIFLVTDSLEAYREMIAQLPEVLQTKMLYKSYLDNFRINIEQSL